MSAARAAPLFVPPVRLAGIRAQAFVFAAVDGPQEIHSRDAQ